MPLNKKQEIKIILIAGSTSSRMVASAFNIKHGTSITVAKLIVKLREKTRSG